MPKWRLVETGLWFRYVTENEFPSSCDTSFREAFWIGCLL
jgi:hypothetical protein